MKTVKRCANDHCNKEFESESHWNKRYCSHKCYQNAKVFRRVARDKTIPFDYDPNDYDNRYVVVLKFPTKERLDREESMLEVDKPVKVVGMNIMWMPSNSTTSFVKQARLDNDYSDDIWVMSKQDEIPDVVKQLLGK